MQINRDYYLNQLIKTKHNGLIKVITGIRRCGKSYLLKNLFYKHLLECGINSDHIIYIPFDDMEYGDIREKKLALSYIKSKIIDKEMYYILLDEVQLIYDKKDSKNPSPFFDVMNSLLHLDNCDIYATGSNSKFLSKDIITTFRGRSIEIKMHPLSFKEYFSVCNLNKEEALKNYMTYGGLPFILTCDQEKEKSNYLNDVFTLIYEKDLNERYHTRGDVEFDEVLSVVSSQIGCYNSFLSLTNTFKSVKKKNIEDKTLKNYIEHLKDAFLINQVMRYDIKGKNYINSSSKFYFEDLGLRNAKLNFRQLEESHLMENLIYNELKIRGYNIDIGNVIIREKKYKDNDTFIHEKKNLEVDFVCNMVSERYYIQSALSIALEDKLLQEEKSLNNINDSFKKIIITKDNIVKHKDKNGIYFINLFDFLLDENSLDM